MVPPITAEEIKEIRGSYGLSQKSFALLLGIGPASMVRYEQGTTPTKANANLIRAARNPEFMAECLENDGGLIPESQRLRAQSVTYDYISLDPKEDAHMHAGLPKPRQSNMTMDEMYHYTLQQEVLNEQAANLIAEIIATKIGPGFSGGADDVFEVLLNQLSLLKPSIISSDMLDDSKLAKVQGFLDCASQILERYQAEVEL